MTSLKITSLKMTTFKEIREEIDRRMKEYVDIAKSDSVDLLLDERDWFTSMLAYIGDIEASAQLEVAELEKAYEEKKYSAFRQAREGKSEKTSDVISKHESLGAKFDFDFAKIKYDTVRRLRERVIKQIDTISQRAAVLRKEQDSNKHQ